MQKHQLATNLTLGIIGKPAKENEHRLPVHPDHFAQIDRRACSRIYVETDYGQSFGVDDRAMLDSCGGVMPRSDIFNMDVVLLPKPLASDLREMPNGRVMWGWPHCVQGQALTQAAIDNGHTLIAWEAMFGWDGDHRGLHVFHTNNEMAGLTAVDHALNLWGADGEYGRPKKVAVISHGAVGRGALRALVGRGFTDVTVFTNRTPAMVESKVSRCFYRQMFTHEDGVICYKNALGEHRPLIEFLQRCDVVVNATLQDPLRPRMFVLEEDVDRLKPNSLIIDVSCDEGMGFPFAMPTSFEIPTFRVGPNVLYYAVDHTPTLLYQDATWEISRALLPYIPLVMAGPEIWSPTTGLPIGVVAERYGNEVASMATTLRRAVEIENGVIQNPAILRFQNRSGEYPHPIVGS